MQRSIKALNIVSDGKIIYDSISSKNIELLISKKISSFSLNVLSTMISTDINYIISKSF